MERTRRVIEERKAAGLSGGMQFTYRNPARSTDPSHALPGARALVVGAWQYAAAGTDVLGPAREASRSPSGRVARYAARDYYADLRGALGGVAEHLGSAGWRARVLADDNALVDRAAAERAGLGWFGKNSNILLPGLGSWFVLGSVVTDAPLSPGMPLADGCGACRRCLGSCPTGALVAPGVLDARRCLAWLLQATGVFPWEHRVALGDRIYGCDDCQEACPANRVTAGMLSHGEAQGGEEAQVAAREAALGRASDTDGGERYVDLVALLLATDDELLARHGRWYIPRRDPRYLRRNALVVLGNSGCGSSHAVEEVLRHHLAHPDELLRAHALWAAARLGRWGLIDEAAPALASDPSELVQRELALLHDVPPAGPPSQARQAARLEP
jgi:epoxyqueuosine reductase